MSTRCSSCPHDETEHTARGGCMNRRESGAICPCTKTTGRTQGSNPFARKADR